jgi:hypothetical protein
MNYLDADNAKANSQVFAPLKDALVFGLNQACQLVLPPLEGVLRLKQGLGQPDEYFGQTHTVIIFAILHQTVKNEHEIFIRT